MHLQDRRSRRQVGLADEHLPVEAAGPQECGIEMLEPVRRAHDDDLILAAEAVQLDQQLVERLVLLAVEAVAAARGADCVELVDEDDRRRALACVLEQPPDARGAEPGEHLDERRCARGEERRARFIRRRLGEQRLAGPGRAVQQDSLGHTRAETFELSRVAEEVDDLLQLRAYLVDAGNIGPCHGRPRPRVDLCRLDARHQLQHAPEDVEQQDVEAEPEEGPPVDHEVAHGDEGVVQIHSRHPVLIIFREGRAST